ncbi:helix-turn-helix domain-containing protein [Streptomyces sp. JNUCC 63]
MAEQIVPKTVEGMPLGYLGRHLVQRRAELGLTLEQTADRAGLAPGYVAYLEEQSLAAPGPAALAKLAAALETTVGELTGGAADLPPGVGRASWKPHFTELSQEECRTLLSTHGVGRLAVPTASGPVVVPVNYSVVDGAIVFRTAPGTTPYLASGCQVGFEVDCIDDASGEGWSVLVRGYARTVTDPDEIRRLTQRAYSTPWVGGERDVWMSIDARAVTGRRVTA